MRYPQTIVLRDKPMFSLWKGDGFCFSAASLARVGRWQASREGLTAGFASGDVRGAEKLGRILSAAGVGAWRELMGPRRPLQCVWTVGCGGECGVDGGEKKTESVENFQSSVMVSWKGCLDPWFCCPSSHACERWSAWPGCRGAGSGCDLPLLLVETVENCYSTFHFRIGVARGRSASSFCLVCGPIGREWAELSAVSGFGRRNALNAGGNGSPTIRIWVRLRVAAVYT